MIKDLWNWLTGSQASVDIAEERIAKRLFEILREGTEEEPLVVEIRVVSRKNSNGKL